MVFTAHGTRRVGHGRARSSHLDDAPPFLREVVTSSRDDPTDSRGSPVRDCYLRGSSRWFLRVRNMHLQNPVPVGGRHRRRIRTLG